MRSTIMVAVSFLVAFGSLKAHAQGYLGYGPIYGPPVPATYGMPIDRHSRMMFNGGLPDYCSYGWNNRGIGLVATCSLGSRNQVRFIDGYVLPCMYPNCQDRAPRVEYFLNYNGY